MLCKLKNIFCKNVKRKYIIIISKETDSSVTQSHQKDQNVPRVIISTPEPTYQYNSWPLSPFLTSGDIQIPNVLSLCLFSRLVSSLFTFHFPFRKFLRFLLFSFRTSASFLVMIYILREWVNSVNVFSLNNRVSQVM